MQLLRKKHKVQTLRNIKNKNKKEGREYLRYVEIEKFIITLQGIQI